MLNSFGNAGTFLIQSIFDLYIFILLLRIVLQWVNTDSHNPLFVFVAKLTNPPLRPICRIIPSLHGIDLAAIILLLGLEMIKIAFLVWLQINATPHLIGLVVLAFAELLNQLINIFFYAVIALTVLSWISPLAHGPLVEILVRISEPLIKPIRGILPIISGFDFSPLILIVGLKLLTILLVQPLAQIGASLALGHLTS
ncbi:YggT family protein [Rickettsiella endosymbiont of Aleochara curtula]|uniref:YggT family protein n=1 Tax=Rickettsiella endosymbiont of Aleochara curtula TaxID=3077936 RepID=UPI00313C5DC9